MPPSSAMKIGVAAMIAMCVAATPAAATGGRDIGSAPSVTYGEQQFGNTLTDSQVADCDYTECRSWWLLPVAAGDRVAIDFEGGECLLAQVWPVGTTDYTVEDTDDDAYKYVGQNSKAELVLKATRTGSMPLGFYDNCSRGAGPYDFIANVQHGLSLSIPHKSSRSRSGTLKVGVHTPEGGDVDDTSLSVELQAKRSGGSWKGYGSATVAESQAAIRYKLPKSFRTRKVSLRAVATGEAYVKSTSSTEHSKIS